MTLDRYERCMLGEHGVNPPPVSLSDVLAKVLHPAKLAE